LPPLPHKIPPSTRWPYVRLGLSLYSAFANPTQPSAFRWMENEYRPRCGDALRLESKGRYDLFRLQIRCWWHV